MFTHTVQWPTSAALIKEKSIISCLPTCYYGTVLSIAEVRLHTAAFCFPLLRVSVFVFSSFLPFLLFFSFIFICFIPSLSCCLSVMWSRTDTGSPNCGTAISALLWLLGSLSETGLGHAPPSSSKRRVAELTNRKLAKIQMILPKLLVSEWTASHLQCTGAYCRVWGFQRST